jgi:hypothetical protein
MNFVPEIYSNLALMERDRESVFIPLCNRDYTEKGTAKDIQEQGDRVHFFALPDPTITAYANTTLDEEEIKDTAVEMVIDQANYFNMAFKDIPKKQGISNIEQPMVLKGRKGLVKVADQYIGALYGSACTTITESEVTSANIISTISDAITELYENDVPESEELSLVVTPAIMKNINYAEILFDTDNSKFLRAGRGGKIKNFINTTVYMSNNVYHPSTVDYCMLFTKEAIAFAEQIMPGSVERLRSTSDFKTIIRALHLYGAKVIKPKELVCLALTEADESVM